MAFFLRKAFRAGPIRFNLSKSGIGVSAGIKGLRVGVGPRGSYVSGGRAGLYFRESLRADRPKAAASDEDPRPAADSDAKAVGGGDPTKPKILWLLAPGLAILTLALASFNATTAFVGILWTGIAAFIAMRRIDYTKNLKAYLDLVNQIAGSKDPSVLSATHAARRKHKFRLEHVQAAQEGAYKDVVAKSIVDSTAGSDATAFPRRVAQALGLAEEEGQRLRVDALKELTWTMLADRRLTAEEEDILRHGQARLGIVDEAIREELAAIEEFRRARELEEAPLPVVESDINLQKGELCHHRTRGALLEERKAGFITMCEGKVYITSKRILVVGDGTQTIPQGKVLDVEVDYDEKLIAITKDGRQKPLYLSVTDPIFSARLIERVSQQD